MPEVSALLRRSTATGQRSMGDAIKLFDLSPPLLSGCPSTSDDDMQYPLEIDYDYGRVDPSLFEQAPLPGMSRWAPLLPPLVEELSMGEGGTALVDAGPLAASIGLDCPLFLKDESRNPTWSHKDRLNYCTVSAAVLNGAPGIVAASSGNHGAAAAAYAARAGLPCIIVTSPAAHPSYFDFYAALGADVVPVPTEERWPVVRRIVAETGFMPMSNLTDYHTGNPFGPEGYKTISYELFLQLGRQVPGTVVMPTGYGELLYGVAKGFMELKRLGVTDRVPAMVSAEPGVAGPLAQALRRNVPAMKVPAAASLASAIVCTTSSARGAKAIRDTAGRALTFSEETLRHLHGELARQGLWQELSGVAALAALKDATRAGIAFEGPVVAVLTSTGLKEVTADASNRARNQEGVLDRLLSVYGRKAA